jgi:hypothetical protein
MSDYLLEKARVPGHLSLWLQANPTVTVEDLANVVKGLHSLYELPLPEGQPKGLEGYQELFKESYKTTNNQELKELLMLAGMVSMGRITKSAIGEWCCTPEQLEGWAQEQDPPFLTF